MKKELSKILHGLNSVTRINNDIQKSKADAMDIIFKLHEAEKIDALTVVELRDKIDKKNSTLSFFFFQEAIDQRTKSRSQVWNS